MGKVGGGEKQQHKQAKTELRSGSSSVAVARPGMRERERRLGRRGLNRGLQVRGALRGSQMVSHKWFTATCEVHEWGELCMDDWRYRASRRQLLQTGTASSPYTRYAEEKERRCFWRQGEGGDWASVDEQDEADLMCGHVWVDWMDSRRCVTPERARISKPVSLCPPYPTAREQ